MGTGYGGSIYHGEWQAHGRLASKPVWRKLRAWLRTARCYQYKKSPIPVGDFLYYPPLKLWRKPDKAHQRCKVTSNHRRKTIHRNLRTPFLEVQSPMKSLAIILVCAGVVAALFAKQIDKVARQNNAIKTIFSLLLYHIQALAFSFSNST